MEEQYQRAVEERNLNRFLFVDQVVLVSRSVWRFISSLVMQIFFLKISKTLKAVFLNAYMTGSWFCGSKTCLLSKLFICILHNLIQDQYWVRLVLICVPKQTYNSCFRNFSYISSPKKITRLSSKSRPDRSTKSRNF